MNLITPLTHLNWQTFTETSKNITPKSIAKWFLISNIALICFIALKHIYTFITANWSDLKFSSSISPITIEETHQKFHSTKEEIKAVDSLKNQWLDDLSLEKNRILNEHLIPSTYLPLYQSKIKNEELAIIGRVLELKRLYKDTHYVFTHGQASNISMINLINQECIKVFTPHFYHPLKSPFRLPHTITYSKNANDFIDTYRASGMTFMDDGYHSDKMISVDAQFWNQSTCESALYFFRGNSNISFTNVSGLKKIFKENFLNYLPHEKFAEQFADKAVKIAQKRSSTTKIGVLYAICIPKEIIQNDKTNFAYHCHAFGRTCCCFFFKNRVTLLNEMQADKMTKCFGGSITQYRILTSRLTEEKGVRSFAVDALPKAKKMEFETEIRALVKELFIFSQLYDLIEKMDEDPAAIVQIDSLLEANPTIKKSDVDQLFDEKPKK